MFRIFSHGRGGGPISACLRFVVLAGAALTAPAPLSAGQANPTAAPGVSVREERGVFVVTARFHVPQAPDAVLAVLTDYAAIPRFMTDVTTSVVRERSAASIVVEQEAVSRVALFSTRVHLVLEISEEAGVLRFRDRCGCSFNRYEGAWQLTDSPDGTEVAYHLAAAPSFDVPDFLLTRVLKRNAVTMIEQLRREIAVRAQPLTAGRSLTYNRR